MSDILDRIKCLFGHHDREYWTKEQCDKARVFDGCWAPWKCRRCNAIGQPMPKTDVTGFLLDNYVYSYQMASTTALYNLIEMIPEDALKDVLLAKVRDGLTNIEGNLIMDIGDNAGKRMYPEKENKNVNE